VFPFSGGEITLLNTSTTRPISLEGSRLEALTHAREGVLMPGSTVPLDDIYDIGDTLSLTYDSSDPLNPIGVFPQGRLVLVSDGGIRISNGSEFDAGSHPPAAPANLEAFGGRITLLNRSANSSLEVMDSTLLNRSEWGGRGSWTFGAPGAWRSAEARWMAARTARSRWPPSRRQTFRAARWCEALVRRWRASTRAVARRPC
jgi:hypothetical protein